MFLAAVEPLASLTTARGRPEGRRGRLEPVQAGSTWNLAASPSANGGSRVEITADRRLKGRDLLLWPFFPLGLARRDVANYLRRFLDRLEAAN